MPIIGHLRYLHKMFIADISITVIDFHTSVQEGFQSLSIKQQVSDVNCCVFYRLNYLKKFSNT